MREIGTVKFDSNQYTDANMLLNFDLIDPVKLNRNLTYLLPRTFLERAR